MLALMRERYRENPCWFITNVTVIGGLCSGMVIAGIVLCFMPNFGPLDGMVLIVSPFISIGLFLFGIILWMGYKKARQTNNPSATAVAPAPEMDPQALSAV
jgi:hypothetical protein